MGVNEEIFRIRYQAEGQAAIKTAAEQVRQLEQRAKQLAATHKGAAASSKQFEAAAQQLAQKLAVARANLDAYNRAAAGGGGSRNMGMAALEAGRALEDLNYGLMGVMNNIPQLAMALGASAGLTGIVAALGAAVLFLSRNWGNVTEAFGIGIPNDTISSLERARTELEEIDKRLDDIRSKPRISLAEKIEAGNLGRRRADLEAEVARGDTLDDLFGGQSDRGREVAKAVGDLVRNSGIDRQEFGSMLVGGIESLGGPQALGFSAGMDATRAAQELLAGAGQGSESSANVLSRVLAASGGQGAGLATQLNTALSGRATGDQFGPTREDMERGREEEQRQAEKDQREEEKRARDEKQALKDRLAAAADQFEFGQRERALAAGVADEQQMEAARQMAAGLLGPMAGPGAGTPGIFDAGSFATQVQAGGAKDPATLLADSLNEQKAQTKKLDDLARSIKDSGMLGT